MTQESSHINVPLLDIRKGNEPLLPEIMQAVTAVCESGWFVGGPDCKKLEQSVAEVCGTEFAVGCASGSEALLVALMAMGVGPGDEVIVPSFTFFATASAVWRLGAEPVFIDIEPTSFNLDVTRIEACITKRTKGIIPVHLFGQCIDMDALNTVAKQHDLFVIEDFAQSIGAKFKGQAAGSMSDVGCVSFYPTKNLGGFGDAGMMTANDPEIAKRLRLLANHGMEPRYHHQVVGINSRLDSIQAAALNVKMKHLHEFAESRRSNAARYHELFKQEGLDQTLGLPSEDSGKYHVWNQYTIRIPEGNRDTLRAELADVGIGSEIYYPIPLHQQECFAPLGWTAGRLPETERAAAEVLSLPISPELTVEQQTYVVTQIGRILHKLQPKRLAS